MSRAQRSVLVAAVAASAMLVGPANAVGSSGRIPIHGGHGSYRYSTFQDPDSGRRRATIAVKACDDDRDGAGIVARVYEENAGDGTTNRLIGQTADRNGTGTCGHTRVFSVTLLGNVLVEVCRNDLSEDGPDAMEGCRDRHL